MAGVPPTLSLGTRTLVSRICIIIDITIIYRIPELLLDQFSYRPFPTSTIYQRSLIAYAILSPSVQAHTASATPSAYAQPPYHLQEALRQPLSAPESTTLQDQGSRA